MPLEVSTSRRGDQLSIVVGGELDMANADLLRDALEDADAIPHRQTVLDLRAVEYFDSTGLGLLLDADRRAAREGRRLLVLVGGGDVRRVLDLVRVTRRLTVAQVGDDACASALGARVRGTT